MSVPHYDPDTRRWMVEVDQFVARPATERERFEAVKAYFVAAVTHADAELGEDVVDDLIASTRTRQQGETDA